MKIAIINGPNLNLLGLREPEKYGTISFDEFKPMISDKFPDIIFYFFQSNVEGELVTAIQKFGFECEGLIVNMGGYSHTSVAIADAIVAIPALIVEVHLTNIFSREEYRHFSIVGSKCKGTVSGFGLNSYLLGIRAILDSISPN
jgi:3-dehydroquinate dehydratase II